MAATTTTRPTAAETAAQTAVQAVKVAQELKARLDRAPKAADPALVKAAAAALVDYRWAHTADAEKVVISRAPAPGCVGGGGGVSKISMTSWLSELCAAPPASSPAALSRASS